VVHPTERLYTVQIAAYLSADSAQALAAKLAARGLPVWTMEVRVGERSSHRIRVGAHPRLGEVRRLGAQISAQYRQEVWVAPVDMSSRIPTNAVEATRALLARP
jgi:cell division septation protein DedD